MDIQSIPKGRLALFAAVFIAVIVLVVIFIFFGNNSSSGPAVSLKVWGTDPKEAFAGIISAYEAARPNVAVSYTQIDPATYDDELIGAFASGKGPDVFMLGNHDVRKYARLISPATSTQLQASQLPAMFPAAASDDLVYRGQVYALPLYMDTLVLAYNRATLDQAGIAVPPATWDDFTAAVPLLRKENAQGQLTTAGAAMGGTSKTVRHSSDILDLLMLQNQATMNGTDGSASFAGGENGNKATGAMRFYMDFANAGSAAYTWNEKQPDSIESFLSGNTAMVFAYQSDTRDFARKSPFLNWGVAAMPQISGSPAVNYPAYSALAAWVGGKNASWAWDFIIKATTDKAAAGTYLTATGRPAALRSILADQASSGSLGLFARQALTAKSWSMPDYDKINQITDDAISKVLRGEASPDEALQEAETAINQLNK